MLSKELKRVIKLSGGKVIISEGDVEDSYVVMKLEQYLKETEGGNVFPSEDGKDEIFEKDEDSEGFDENDLEDELEDDLRVENEEKWDLTNEELLDRINSDIALLKQRNAEDELDAFLDEGGDKIEDKELDYMPVARN